MKTTELLPFTPPMLDGLTPEAANLWWSRTRARMLGLPAALLLCLGCLMVPLGASVQAATLTAISPASGTTAGGTSVTLTGTGFTGATGVTLGGTAATGVTVVSDTTITCTTPAGTAGTASVVVTTPGGANAANTLYTYTAPSAAAQNYTFTTLAGLALNAGTTDGTGSAARFSLPSGVGVDSAGNVYGADTFNHTIRKVTPGGVVTTLAGLAGVFGSTDDTGSAARFYFPHGVAVDSAGNVYVADTDNHTIRKVTSVGTVSTLAGQAGSNGSSDGTGSAARFKNPRGVAVDSAGNVYVTEYGNHTIRMVTPGGVVTTLAGLAGSFGSSDGTGSAARFNGPAGVGVDSAGNVYVADSVNHTIRMVTPGGVVTTLVGLAGSLGSSDGTGSAARFHYPSGVAVNSAGNVFVGDTYNHTIRKIAPGAGVTTIGGLAGSLGSSDGTGSVARFRYPYGVAVDNADNVYVADAENHTIRKGVVTNCVSGETWTPRESNRIWRSVASSDDGTKLVAVVSGGLIYTSTDSGVTWTARDSLRNWRSVASSADGTKLVAVTYGGQIYTSTDLGATWTARESNRHWY